jgi:HD-GYP domain-containing protein (c-di-GMP phosphodiesterase class II)
MSAEFSLKIICSPDVNPFIPEESIKELELEFVPQVAERVLSLIRDENHPVLLVACLKPSEALVFDDFFRSYSPKKLMYSLSVFAEHDRGLEPLSRLENVGLVNIGKVSAIEFLFNIRNLRQNLIQRYTLQQQVVDENPDLLDQKGDQEALIRIGKALNIERDPDKLLRTILYLSKKITGADAGSIFLVEGEGVDKRLRFKYSHTFSKELEYEEFTIPIDTSSLAGYVAVTGENLNFPDVYELEPGGMFHFNSTFDKEHGYRTKSMLVTPMVNHLGNIIGVIQLINSKENFDKIVDYSGNEAYEIILERPEDFATYVVPFKKRYEDLMEAVAGQAAIALENSQMLRQIETQFEEFVKASVSAIESRDPATSGHSFRVARMSVAMAKAINNVKEGPLQDVIFTDENLKELEFACLLHDFGKVYVDLDVIMKAKKLYPKDYDYLNLRLAYLERSLELENLQQQMALLEDRGKGDLPVLRHRNEENRQRIQTLRDKIKDLNEPSVWVENRDDAIEEILSMAATLEAKDWQGKMIPVFTEDEIENLRIVRGSLNQAERELIQSHVVHTFNFVKNIPWPQEYRNIPDIAVKHHEMLDGSGYPNKLTAKDIQIQARIMAVADVFDALTASDRPYKKALPLDKALSILEEEVEVGRLDGNLVQLFIQEQLFEILGDFEETGTHPQK